MTDEPIGSPLYGGISRVPAHCDAHGAYSATALRGRVMSGCPDCGRVELERLKAKEAEAWRLEQQQQRLDAIGLRGWLQDATFDNFLTENEKQREAKAAARRFAAEVDPHGRGGLWLLGPPGVGKSHLGAAIAQAAVVQRGLWAQMITPREIVRTIRATWRPDSDDMESDVIKRLGRVDLLVLDEIGTGLGTDAEIAHLFDVVDLRSQLCRPTVVLSNLNVKGVKAAVGERIFDRLQHGATLTYCNWPSHRKPAGRGDDEASTADAD